MGCCDGDLELLGAQGECVLEVTPHNEFKRILQNFFPAFASTRFGLVSWMPQTKLTNRLGAMSLKEGAFKGQGRVEAVHTAKQHGARLAFDGIRSFVDSSSADRSGVGGVSFVLDGLPVLHVSGRSVSVLTPPRVGADMLTLGEYRNVHVGDRNANDVGVDGIDDEIQDDFLLTGHNVLDVAHHEARKRLGSGKDQPNRAKDNNQEQYRENQAPSKATAPPAIAAVSTF